MDWNNIKAAAVNIDVDCERLTQELKSIPEDLWDSGKDTVSKTSWNTIWIRTNDITEFSDFKTAKSIQHSEWKWRDDLNITYIKSLVESLPIKTIGMIRAFILTGPLPIHIDSNSTTPEELEEFLAPLSAAGVDIFHCSNRRFWDPEFEGSTLNLAGWVKKITNKPTISVGSVGLTEEFIATYREGTAEVAGIDELVSRMEADEFDLIAVGRALLANPDWSNKVRDGDMGSLRTFSREQLTELV